MICDCINMHHYGILIHIQLSGGKNMNGVLEKIDNLVWGMPLIVMILAIGFFLTIRLHGLQVTCLPQAIRNVSAKNKDGQNGEVSSFGALCTALSATIGTGNIVGVATAIVAGGPGALFWMWIAAFLGTATKYSECLLAVKFRNIAPDGHIVGGPFCYIENGMGKKWKWLACLFAFFGAAAGLMGIGTSTQTNGITSAVHNFFDPESIYTVALFGHRYSWSVVISAVVITVCAGLVIIGGLQRISKVAEFIVPFMAVLYIILALIILITHASTIPGAFVTIVQSAFGMRAVSGGAMGAMLIAMQKGIARGIFSNEAGLGSAPIAAAAAHADMPAEQGLVSMLGTIIDTLIICTMTGLSIIITDSWNIGLEGVAVSTKAFQLGLPFPSQVAAFCLMLCLVFFAFTTILGWNYYSERCLDYLTNGNTHALRTFRWLYLLAVLIGPFMTVSAVWTIADIFNGLMAIPNLIALVALSGITASETQLYLEKLKAKKEISRDLERRERAS